jgi:hypothetical protein
VWLERGGTGGWVGVEGAGEVRGLDHDSGLGINFHVDLDLVAGHDTGGLPVGVAEAEQETAAHDRDSASPGMLVDRDDHRRALASTERLHNLCQSAFPTWFVSSVRPGTIVDEEWGRWLFVRAQTERSSRPRALSQVQTLACPVSRGTSASLAASLGISPRV